VNHLKSIKHKKNLPNNQTEIDYGITVYMVWIGHQYATEI